MQHWDYPPNIDKVLHTVVDAMFGLLDDDLNEEGRDVYALPWRGRF